MRLRARFTSGALWIGLPIAVAAVCAIAGFLCAPQAYEAGFLLVHADDPADLADHLLDGTFTRPVVEREIVASLLPTALPSWRGIAGLPLIRVSPIGLRSRIQRPRPQPGTRRISRAV